MDRATELGLIEEIGALLAGGTTAMASDVARVPAAQLVGPARTALETEVLFRNHPLALAPSAAIPTPGDFVTDEVAGLPLLVVRGDDGVARVLLNACRHRGNLVCEQATGNRRVFSCSYHAWAYDRAGACRTVVDRAGFEGLDRTELGLRQYPCQERHGLIWFVPRLDADIDVESYLGEELDAELSGFASHTAHLFASEKSEFPFNWKFGVNTFQELFHLGFLHKVSLGRAFISNVSTFRSYAPHQRLTVIRSTFPEMLTEPEDRRTLFPHCSIVYVLFPNTVLVWQLDHLELWRFTPSRHGDGACEATLWLLTDREPETEKAVRHWQRNWDKTLETVHGEDFATMTNIQRNLSTGALDEIVYGRNEIGLQDFHRQVTAATLREHLAARLPQETT